MSRPLASVGAPVQITCMPPPGWTPRPGPPCAGCDELSKRLDEATARLDARLDALDNAITRAKKPKPEAEPPPPPPKPVP